MTNQQTHLAAVPAVYRTKQKAVAFEPTSETYEALQSAYEVFNAHLFGGALPPCLITMQRVSKAYGYFAPDRFGAKATGQIADEIALNPSYFSQRSTMQSLSTLAHEMAHLWQHHYGQTSRNGYHNSQWADKMEEIGLIPSDTGEAGGKRTGQRMTHYIQAGGRFEEAFKLWESGGYSDFMIDLWDLSKAPADPDDPEQVAAVAAKIAAKKAKAQSKTKHVCPSCSAKAWGKLGIKLICGDCDEPLMPEA